ncbi:hypothetical protein [Streptomyces sp. NBC_01614]|uniref:hypothetical protein n=1 Tax=Streptomyces sp. NBC_01614 TaxID=2975897 RepID=UPI00386E76A5
MKSSHATQRDLAWALRQQAKRMGERSPSVRGADWRLATITAVNADGTIVADDITARRLESYLSPAIGDVVVLDQNSMGNWLCRGRLATGSDPIGGFRVARKTGDTARTSTIAQAADPHLSFAVQANAAYLMDGWIKYDADAAGDISLDWTVPAGSLGEWTGSGASIDTTGAANGYSVQLAATDIDALRSFGGAGAGANLTIDIKGTLRVAATAGTYALTWAQRVSSGTATTVYTDSWLRLHRVA